MPFDWSAGASLGATCVACVALILTMRRNGRVDVRSRVEEARVLAERETTINLTIEQVKATMDATWQKVKDDLDSSEDRIKKEITDMTRKVEESEKRTGHAIEGLTRKVEESERRTGAAITTLAARVERHVEEVGKLRETLAGKTAALETATKGLSAEIGFCRPTCQEVATKVASIEARLEGVERDSYAGPLPSRDPRRG